MKIFIIIAAFWLAGSIAYSQSTTSAVSTDASSSAILQTLLTSATPLQALHIMTTVTPPNGKPTYNTDIYVQANGQWRKVQHKSAGDQSDDTTSGERVITETDGSKFASPPSKYDLLDFFPVQTLAAQLANPYSKNIQYVGMEQLFGSSLLHFRIGSQTFVSQAKQPTHGPRSPGDADVFVDPNSRTIAAIGFVRRPVPLITAIPKTCFDSSNRVPKYTNGRANISCINRAYPPMLSTLVHYGDFRPSAVGLVPFSVDVSLQGNLTHYTIKTLEASAQ